MAAPTQEELKVAIKTRVTQSILLYATKAAGKKAAYQPLDLVMPAERKIRSIVGGLETSLGTTLWEPLAKQLAGLNGFIVKTQNLEVPKIMPNVLSTTLETVIEQRIIESGMYDAVSSHQTIKNTCRQFVNNPIPTFIKPPSGLGVDLWFVKDGINYFFDTKTVQPNIGDFAKYLRQIICWYGYFYSKFPLERAEARIVFPYNPYSGDFFVKTKKNARPLTAHTEVWVENEFWDFCSGVPNTFQIIEECFREIHTSGVLSNAFERLFWSEEE